MADGAPLKYIDIKKAFSDFGNNALNKSLAFTGILPGQGDIPPPSQEFLDSKRNPFPNALPGPRNQIDMDSLAQVLNNMKQNTIIDPGNQAIADRQDRGFFANTINDRMKNFGL